MYENILLRLLEENSYFLRQCAALLAADYGFRSAVHSGDEDTIQSVLENHGERIGAAATALLDADMTYRALTAPSSAQAFIPTLGQVAPQLARSPRAARLPWWMACPTSL